MLSTVASAAWADAAVKSGQSPRASLAQFLELVRQGDLEGAAHFMDVPAARSAEAGKLARRFKLVLDRHVWFDLQTISDQPNGRVDDGLPADIEQVATVPGPSGSQEPVRMVRRQGRDPAWVFTAATVARIDHWHERLGNRWLSDRLPSVLLEPGPRELLWWQWLAMPLVALLAWLAGTLLAFVTRSILMRVAARTHATWDDIVIERLRGPMRLGWALLAASALVPWLGLYTPAEAFIHGLLRGLGFVVFFWALARGVDVTGQLIAASQWAQHHPASRSLVPLGSRVLKVGVLAVAVVALLSAMGYPVASLIAGLGIGGLAVALAAQKTVENLIGAFAIGADQPFREGDFVKVEDFVGTVETIGLRSTRIRTLDRTVISLPNGRLADMRLESFTARDRIRLHCILGVVYGTTAAQMREILSGLEKVLRSHPRLWPDALVVRFREFGASSLDIEIMAWFLTSDFAEFQGFRQEVLLQFMEVVENAGSSFAFPTRTLHIVPPEAAAALTQAGGNSAA